MKKIIEEETKSKFLESLKDAVESGDASKGADSINKINEIHKLASTMKGNNAAASFIMRVEDAGEAKSIDQEEANEINLKAKEELHQMKEVDDKLKIIADISNAEIELKELNKEFKEISKQYLKIIENQETLIEEMKNKFDKIYSEDGETATKEYH